jgi:hypothetical protein
MFGKRNLAPKSGFQAEHEIPSELTKELALRDKSMKNGGSVRPDYTTVVAGNTRYVEVSDSFWAISRISARRVDRQKI